MRTLLPIALVATLIISTAFPARADDDPPLAALMQLLEYVDQVYYQPNGYDFEFMERYRSAEMAILMGLAIRTQYPHASTPAKDDALNQLADRARDYLDLLAQMTLDPTDAWGNSITFENLNWYFETAATTEDFDQYSQDAYGVNPNGLQMRDLLASLAASSGGGNQVGPGAGIYEPRDDGDSVVLLDQPAGPVANPDVQGDMNFPAAPPAPDYGPITDNDILGRWVSQQSGEAISFQSEGQHKIVGRFENTAHVDYGPGYENMTYNWQPASITLQLTEAFDMEWGLQFKGRFCGSGGCENLVVELWHEKDGRIAMAYDGFVLADGPFFKQ